MDWKELEQSLRQHSWEAPHLIQLCLRERLWASVGVIVESEHGVKIFEFHC